MTRPPRRKASERPEWHHPAGLVKVKPKPRKRETAREKWERDYEAALRQLIAALEVAIIRTLILRSGAGKEKKR